MGTRYTTTPAVAFNSGPPIDDGSQVASNLITWAGVKTKLADPVHTQADSIDSKLVSALDLSARAISGNDTAIASDHWKTLQVTGTTTIQLSSAASMGAGYEVGVFNAGVGVVTVTPAGSDTINLVSSSVTVPLKGTKIFRTNSALTGYNEVAESLNYAEGLWTPSLGGTTTYTTQSGVYTKIGRLVFIQGELSINIIGTGSTSVVSGLPFTPTSFSVIPVTFSSSLVSNMVSVTGLTGSGAATITFYSRGAAGDETVSAIFKSATQLKFSGCYQS